MEINNRYLLLLNKLIYDPRIKANGMITSIEITPLFSSNGLHYGIWYKVFFDRIHNDSILLVEDIEDKRIKFLLPFNLALDEKDEKEYQEKIIKDLKEYFGDHFSEDIIMRIPEEERQKQIKALDKILNSLHYWDKYTG